MHGENIPYGYGFWSLVVFNAAFFVIFVLSFLTPLRRREWRSFGMYSAFIVALFTEMTAIHIVSNALMFGGLLIIHRGWRRVHRAQGALVTDGLYAWVRHPQYSGLFLITIGLLIQWPTIITALTWPILLLMYVRLARRSDFLHTYGAFILVVLVLLSPIMLLVFCRAFLSAGSDPDDGASGREGGRAPRAGAPVVLLARAAGSGPASGGGVVAPVPHRFMQPLGIACPYL